MTHGRFEPSSSCRWSSRLSGISLVHGYGAFRFGAIIWKGNFGHDQARGTVQYVNGHSNCSSGVVTWTAEQMGPRSHSDGPK